MFVVHSNSPPRAHPVEMTAPVRGFVGPSISFQRGNLWRGETCIAVNAATGQSAWVEPAPIWILDNAVAEAVGIVAGRENGRIDRRELGRRYRGARCLERLASQTNPAAECDWLFQGAPATTPFVIVRVAPNFHQSLSSAV